MKTKPYSNQDGSTLICALCTILIISLIGANVLLNCTTRYNVSSKQVKGWKEASYAAEGGADIAFSEVRKLVSSPSTAFLSSGGWTTTAGPSYSNGPYSFVQNNSLSTNVTGALKLGNSVAGPGHAGLIDSYNSKNGTYPGASIAANPVPPTDPNYNYYIYSRQGNVSVGTASFTDWGPIYGSVTTNGGNVTS